MARRPKPALAVPLRTWGATVNEISASLDGDALIVDPGFSATRAITVDGPPERAFAWLAQMGTGRAGWYSYDLIDNFGRRSARHIDETWAVTTSCDQVPAGPITFVVASIDAPSSLVLALRQRRVAGHTVSFTLAYDLQPTPGNRTRVVSRARALIDGPLSRLLHPVLEFGDGLMVRRQLVGLQQRCR